MWNIMVSRELSLRKLATTYLMCVLGFGALCVILAKTGVDTQFVVLGGVVYAVVIALCMIIFAVNWDIAVPNFREWREAQNRNGGGK